MMEKNAAGGEANVEAPEVSKEEISLATEVMQSFVKTSKGSRMYLANNPLLVRFIVELMAKMTRHLELYGEFRLDVDQFVLRYKGKTVYENSDPSESMAFKIYSDGIRFLIFTDGIEEYELCEFLEIVGKDRPSDVDDDIVTLLWEKNLPHIVYVLAEDFLEFDSAGGLQVAPGSQQEKISGIFKSISGEAPPPSPLLVPQKILTLDNEDTQWIRKNKEAEEKKKPLEEVVQIVCSILAGEKDPELFDDFLDILVKLSESLVSAGEIKFLFSIVKFLRNLANHEQTLPVRRELIARATDKILTEATLKAIARTIDAPDGIPPEDMLAFLHSLGREALPRVCDLLGFVQNPEKRQVIVKVLLEMGHETPEAFLPFLSDKRATLVRDMLFILTRIGTPMVFDPVVALMSHRDLAVRKEVLNYLDKIQDAKAKNCIFKFLRDESSIIRIRALQLLSHANCTFALKPIVAMAASDQFADKEMVEKKAIYEALGGLGSDQMIPMFREMLMKRHWFNKAKEKDAVICAVHGLLKVQSAAAVKLLEEAREKSKSDEAKAIITKALEAMGGEHARKVPEAEEV
jgi:HEAT repeat protein